ncbi:IS21-like element helper ATPase IstB [Arachidicoccus ginsenosidivorans]|nr:IS21-like element helper ATPase IstB [Arachidicoccus ginsenosidivorans]
MSKIKQTQKLDEQCKQLRVPAIGEWIVMEADQCASGNISYIQFLERTFGKMLGEKEKKYLEAQIKNAQLPNRHDLAQFDCSLVEGISPIALSQLKELTWVDQSINLIIMGPPGVGKTMLSAGLCHHAIQSGYKAYFRKMDALTTTLIKKDINRSCAIEYRRLLKANLVVIDDIMMIEPDSRKANAFFHFINEIYESASIIITTNKSPSNWVEKLGDEVLTAAILDRILHHSEIINLAGESQRRLSKREGFSLNSPSPYQRMALLLRGLFYTPMSDVISI